MVKTRLEFGYKDVQSNPLLIVFCGQPYIDTRASLNSFIPKNLPLKTSMRLIDAYTEILEKNPHLHYKIEFEIAFTSWMPDLKKEAEKRLLKYDIKIEDIEILEEELKLNILNAIKNIDNIKNSTKNLVKNFKRVKNSKAKEIDKIYQLISDCKIWNN